MLTTKVTFSRWQETTRGHAKSSHSPEQDVQWSKHVFQFMMWKSTSSFPQEPIASGNARTTVLHPTEHFRYPTKSDRTKPRQSESTTSKLYWTKPQPVKPIPRNPLKISSNQQNFIHQNPLRKTTSSRISKAYTAKSEPTKMQLKPYLSPTESQPTEKAHETNDPTQQSRGNSIIFSAVNVFYVWCACLSLMVEYIGYFYFHRVTCICTAIKH